MKLLVVAQKADCGDENLGAFCYWFEEFSRRCERVVILSSGLPSGQAPAGTRVHSFFARTRLGRLGKFWELFSREYPDCDAVLFHQIPEFVLAASPFLLALKKPSGLWYAHKTITWKLKIAEKLVRYVFTSSSEGFRLPSKKVLWVGQAIDTELFSPAASGVRQTAPEQVKMISVGRIAPVKNYEVMIDALAILKKETGGKFILDIIGGPLTARDTEYMAALERKIDEAGLKDSVRFLGPRPYEKIPSLLQSHDLFINMSHTGSLDKAVLEAMSCGLTVITANEAYRDMVPEKYFLTAASAEALAAAVAKRAAEPGPHPALREIVLKNHSLDRTIEKILFSLSQ